MTADDFRAIALGMEGASESAHMGHPDFRVKGKVFATLHAGRSGTVRLDAEVQREVLESDPEAFTPAAGAWGRRGWTTIRLHAADEASVRAAVLLAWRGGAGRGGGRFFVPGRRHAPLEHGPQAGRLNLGVVRAA